MPKSPNRPVLFLCATLLLVAPLCACGGGAGDGGGGGGDPAPEDPYVPPPQMDLRLNTDPEGEELSVFPEVCCSGTRVFATWYDRRNGDTDVFFSRSIDGGKTWFAEDVRLDTDTAGAAGSNVPRICCSGDRIYVAWSDQRAGLSQIRFNRSLDAGATWLDADVRLDRDLPEAGSSTEVDLCCSGDQVYVVWHDTRNGERDIYFNRSVDAGTTWLAADARLDTDVQGAAESLYPQIVLSDPRLFVVWEDHRDGAGDIRCSRSLNRGDSWLVADERLDTDDAGSAASMRPRVAHSGSQITVVWEDARDGETDIRGNASIDDGESWMLDDVRLDTDEPGASVSTRPSICCRGSRVFVVWEDLRQGLADIRFTRSLDGGVNWRLGDVRLDTGDPGAARSLSPQMVCTSSHVHVVWYDDRAGAFDVLFTSSDDNGSTWTLTETRLNGDGAGLANSLFPRLCGNAEIAHTVWYDERQGPGDIYYNRASGPCG